MGKSFNWKPYKIFILLTSILIVLINQQLAIGFMVGNACFFINDIILANKFKNIKETSIVLNIIVHMILQLILVGVCAYTAWNIGGLIAFISMVIGFSLPNVFFIISSSRIKK